jgi:sodium transport system ATP-binding protein
MCAEVLGEDGLIEVRDLVKVYRDADRGDVRALGGVSFRAARGEVYGVIGPNGAGKTTLLRILGTILRPTSGTASVAGHDVAREPEAVRRLVGFQSASTGLYDRLTSREMVEYFGRLHGMAGPELSARIDGLFDALDMVEFRDTFVSRLSTGTKQKVSLARTIVHDPPVVILDEPTAGLDIMVARRVLELVADLRRADRTVILSTHVMREAEKLCDRIALIDRGRLIDEGSLAELRLRANKSDLDDIFFSLVGEEREPRRSEAL